MNELRTVFCLLLLALLPVQAQEPSAGSGGSATRRALNVAFKGRILRLEKRRVTIYYDFEDPAQLEDFEAARPPRLLDASRNRARIEDGKLVLEGSTSIRQKMEGKGSIEGRFKLTLTRKHNVGAVVTEPVLSDFYMVYNLFDLRFNRNGNMHIGACGLREDEGAEDSSSGLVNFRDIFSGNLHKEVKVGREIEVEIRKDGWKEFFRVGTVKGRGSSKGKTKDMRSCKFGLFVHGSTARFDDLTITLELAEQYLDLEGLVAALDPNFPSGPDPLAGLADVPRDVRQKIRDFESGGNRPDRVVEILARSEVSEAVRCAAAKVLAARGGPKVIPHLIAGLGSEDKVARTLSIQVVKSIVGQTFGYSPDAGKKRRAESIERLKAFLTEHRERYYGR